MQNFLRVDRTYLVLTILLLGIEVCIAAFVNDSVIRPYVGDILVVILMYCFIRSLTTVSIEMAAVSVLFFAYFVEALQYFNILKRLDLEEARLIRIVLGNSFEWLDMLMYTLGFMIIILIESKRKGIHSAPATAEP